MENPFLQIVNQIPKPLRQPAPPQSFCGEFSIGEDLKTDLNPHATFKVSQEELSNLFNNDIFGQFKSASHQCTICERVFPYRYQLIVHSRYHALPNEQIIPKPAENKLLGWPNYQKPENKTQYPCSYCEKCFSRKEHLASHMAKHTGENLHECHLCSKSFSRKDHLENHIRAHENDFKCQICLKIFTRKEHLVNHVQWHNGTSPHKCGLCRKVFTRKEHLVNHVRQHTGESPHVCRFCGKAFTRREHVVNHERAHTGETPFKCTECGRAFSRRDHLVAHERSHAELSPFKCFPCNKAFTKKEHLASHQRHHHAVRSKAHKEKKQPQKTVGNPEHTCEVCHKSFNLRGNLLFHMKSHAGNREVFKQPPPDQGTETIPSESIPNHSSESFSIASALIL